MGTHSFGTFKYSAENAVRYVPLSVSMATLAGINTQCCAIVATCVKHKVVELLFFVVNSDPRQPHHSCLLYRIK